MGKLFLAVLCASTLASGGSTMQGPTITISPTPPSVGDVVTITYTGRTPVILNLEWYPPNSGPATIRIGAGGSATLTIPQADSLIVSDPTPAGAQPVSTAIY